MSYEHRIRIRYGECDQQGVVFHAHYLAYMDDATEVWVRSLSPDGDYRNFAWEWMVVRCAIEWQDSARDAELLSIDVGIVRYGDTSFDFGFVGRVGERPVFAARSVCVSVRPVTLAKMSTPDPLRACLGPPAPLDVPA